MSDDMIINVKQLLEHAPSSVATHYHLGLYCYLSVTEDKTYAWCSVNEEWIETIRPLQNDALVIEFETIKSDGFCRVGLIPCNHCNTETENHLMMGLEGEVSLECERCGMGIEIYSEIWASIKKIVKPYSV
ncbi:hypothetical protein SO574_23385 (plasmid) [Vibrio alfacsensis]|uniref:hypothetical protein n=1 Tax=Vibrio alfacsensis TaxID=1074311 RepID=UPI002ADE720E|nr:hypothetical protein [Vibrio alfacsensis]WQE79484.1 hypothetical protein SO574_23385 [Vibrio alfacsensis]